MSVFPVVSIGPWVVANLAPGGQKYAAVNAKVLQAALEKHATVIVPEGLFYIDDTIRLDRLKHRLAGVSLNSHLHFAGSKAQKDFIHVTGPRSEIANLTITTTNAEGKRTGCVIHIDGSPSVNGSTGEKYESGATLTTLRNLSFSEWDGKRVVCKEGIRLSLIYTALLDSIDTRSCDAELAMIHLVKSNGVRLKNSKVQNLIGAGIRIHKGASNAIRDCTIEKNLGGGVVLDQTRITDGTVIDGCYFEQNTNPNDPIEHCDPVFAIEARGTVVHRGLVISNCYFGPPQEGVKGGEQIVLEGELTATIMNCVASGLDRPFKVDLSKVTAQKGSKYIDATRVALINNGPCELEGENGLAKGVLAKLAMP